MKVLDAQLLKADRYGDIDRQLRAPQLAFLKDERVVVFGLGCIGAPSALELARAGVGRLHLVDHDTVDAATTLRWPFGVASAGLSKVQVLQEFIADNYPCTAVTADARRVGSVSLLGAGELEGRWLTRVLQDASVVYDATAEVGIQDYLADVAHHLRIPYVTAFGTRGGWGGEVVRIAPGVTAGCWRCLRCMYKDGKIPVPAEDPSAEDQPAGCGDPTFQAAGFDMVQVAMTGVRLAVSTLSDGTTGSYPPFKWDGMVLSMRDSTGALTLPRYDGYNVAVHPRCRRCNRGKV